VHFKYWEFPYLVVLEARDSEIARLDKLAAVVAGDDWGTEFDRDYVGYRFLIKFDAVKFAIFAGVPVISQPVWRDGT
jgi:hypothetical protein